MTLDVRPLGFWNTTRLLLRVASARAKGRRERQRDLLNNRAGRNSTNWGALGFAFTVLFLIALNFLAAFLVGWAFESGARVDLEHHGKILVSENFYRQISSIEEIPPTSLDETSDSLSFSNEAHRYSEKYGGKEADIEQKLRAAVSEAGSKNLVTSDDPAFELAEVAKASRLATMFGTLVILWWVMMLAFQGEGLELDIQRRRHPMWEFLFSHPVPIGAVFLSEMISPIAANPIYWGGPAFVAVLYSRVYDPAIGALAGVVIGIPLTIAIACMGKALEIAVTLRFPTRSRGAMIGLMSWLGYSSMILMFVGVYILESAGTLIARILHPLAAIPWPWLRLFLGGTTDGSFSFLFGMFNCWVVSIVTVGCAIWFSVWSTKKGLSGGFASDQSPSSAKNRAAKFGKEPLYRKEFLWFTRDRSAIVQTILIPLTVASVQVFNLRSIVNHAQSAWNYLCGAGILFGTYFLLILGPKSLASEGEALWITLTWPRGLESLLKAKAWLWSLISSGMVLLVLCYAAFLFPQKIGAITLVFIGWFIFSRSMAEKAVTLVTVTSSSGEQEKVPKGRQWATQLGMLTFAIGILTQQWTLAVVGIVYSYMTAAAMWQNFRARLPYLYDPWSEKLPEPPTLMHAMIAISILVEGAAVLTGIVIAFSGRESIAIAQAFGYAIGAIAVSIGMAMFLDARNVSLSDIFFWKASPADSNSTGGAQAGGWSLRAIAPPLLGAGGGLLLGLLARGYLILLQHIPTTAEIIRKSQESMSDISGLKFSYAVMAVVFAPFAEEYLFRGLLYRALDREWGGWYAIIGSAAFFAIYHPPLSWIPVALVGATNAILFKKTGQLAPAIILHTVYNAVVLLDFFKL